MRDVVRSRCVKPPVFAGCLVIASIAMTETAAAHVKWFVDCGVSDDPLPVRAVLTTSFFQFLGLFLSLFYLGCMAERTLFGAMLLRLLDRCTAPLHGRADELIRAAAAVFFALLWAQGGLILTPELNASSISLSATQLLIPICLFTRTTLPVAGAGILILYGYGVVEYGLFHMLDYPVFLGLGAYFILSLLQNARILSFRYHLLRWTAAFSLLWPSTEKFVYPGWIAPITALHPELTLGLPVATVITAAGVVEFGLSFALFWTPMVRRLAALALILLLTAATFDFGKVDGIGHLIFIAILLVVLADPEGKPTRCHPVFAPLLSSVALLATISLYSAGHALYYVSESATPEPYVIGVLVPISTNWLLD